MTNEKIYYYGVLKETKRHGFAESAEKIDGEAFSLTASEMYALISQHPQKHIEWDDQGRPIAVPYGAQYWGEFGEEGRLLRSAGYRFSEACVRIEEPNWDE